MKARDQWGSRLGVILAVAGSAVGLGNFLRFPVRAVANGGGAFMVPYLIALIVLGIPLAWVEWTLGRYGGQHSHGSGPGVYHRLTKGRPWAKYLGVVTIFIPLTINFYYVFIEGWTLAFSFFAATGTWDDAIARGEMDKFLNGFVGAESNAYFDGPWTAITVFLIVFLLNYWVIFKGIRKGIEYLARIGMPILLACAFVLVVRVLTLGTPDSVHPDWNVGNALGFMWNPDWSRLASARVWIEATGQIFFTLSVGMGAIMAYASYLRSRDDVTLSALTAASTNEFTEVVLGGSIAIVAAATFFGAAGAAEIANSGAFSLGFITMPYVFAQMGAGGIMGFLWFFLLFLAGVTSSVSLIQPLITFLKDELNIGHGRAIVLVACANLLITGFLIGTMRWGTLDEMDFWAGSVLPVISALVMVLIFAFFLGINKGFIEMHRGAEIRVPGIYKYIIKYVMPVYLIALLVFWGIQDWWPTATMQSITDPTQALMIGITRGIMFVILLFLLYLIYRAHRLGRFPKLTGGDE
ncbi:sodium-dependent transporter [bacterium]|nr:sodium-dependent transporter [bacterium]MBU1983659.1 sodium-dependent transporter [bacterium]